MIQTFLYYNVIKQGILKFEFKFKFEKIYDFTIINF